MRLGDRRRAAAAVGKVGEATRRDMSPRFGDRAPRRPQPLPVAIKGGGEPGGMLPRLTWRSALGDSGGGGGSGSGDDVPPPTNPAETFRGRISPAGSGGGS